MSEWLPVLSPDATPLYKALADAIALGVERGDLGPGERLPPQRDLARRLGVALTTVTRGYAEAERRGLVRGEVGRGTFVRGRETPVADEGGFVDLHTNALLPLPQAPELLDRFARLMQRGDPIALFGYAPHRGTERQREAGAELLRRVGLATSADRVLVTHGAQHAMAVVFATITDPGDTVLVENVTYSGMKSLASLLRIRLHGLPMDHEGLRPDALREACAAEGKGGRVKAIYCIPTLQNPTGALMSDERRLAIATIADEFGIPIVEDDSYGFLLPDRPRLAGYTEAAYYLTGTSKSLIPSLRVGFIRAPGSMTDRLEAAISATIYYTSSFLGDTVATWIDDGTAERVMAWKREEVRARQTLARTWLAPHGYTAHPASPHGWLRLPEPWTSRDVVAQAAMRGVHLSPAESYAVGRDAPPHAVRISVGPTPNRSALERGLRTLTEIIAEQPEPTTIVV